MFSCDCREEWVREGRGNCTPKQVQQTLGYQYCSLPGPLLFRNSRKSVESIRASVSQATHPFASQVYKVRIMPFFRKRLITYSVRLLLFLCIGNDRSEAAMQANVWSRTDYINIAIHLSSTTTRISMPRRAQSIRGKVFLTCFAALTIICVHFIPTRTFFHFVFQKATGYLGGLLFLLVVVEAASTKGSSVLSKKRRKETQPAYIVRYPSVKCQQFRDKHIIPFF